MPLAIILNNQAIGKNCPEIAAVRNGKVEQNVTGEAWIIKPENLTSVWRPECDVWEVAILGEGTYAGSHKVRYLRQPNDVELNQYGVYTQGVTGSEYNGVKVVKDTGYVVAASPSINLTAENASITCDKGSSGVINAYKSNIHISEGTNITLHAKECTVTMHSGVLVAEDSKVTSTCHTVITATNCTVEARGNAVITSHSSKVTAYDSVYVKPDGCTVHASDDCVVSCYDKKVRVTASGQVVCIVDNIEEAHATGAFGDSFAKQKFLLSDNAVIVSKKLGDYVWTPSGKYYPSAVKGASPVLSEVKRGRPRKEDIEVAVE